MYINNLDFYDRNCSPKTQAPVTADSELWAFNKTNKLMIKMNKKKWNGNPQVAGDGNIFLEAKCDADWNIYAPFTTDFCSFS